MNANVAIGAAIVLVAIGGFLYYQNQQAAAQRYAYEHSLGGAIGTTIGGIGNIVGAAVGMAGNGGSSHQ